MLVVNKKCGWSEGGVELSVSGRGERWEWGMGVGDGWEKGNLCTLRARKIDSESSNYIVVFINRA